MRILIPVFSPATGTWGGLTRVIAVAEAALNAGHQAAFCASGALLSTLKQRGYPVYPVPSPTLFGLPRAISEILARRSQRVALPIRPGRDFGTIWFVLLLSGMARLSYLSRLVEAEQRAVHNFRADFLFTDLDPGACLAAKIEQLPLATAYQTPMQKGTGSAAWKLISRAMNRVLENYHCSPQTADRLFHGPQVLKIIPSIPELEETDETRQDVRFVGHLLGNIQKDRDFKAESGKRYIFTYLGTGAVPLDKARKVLAEIFPAHGSHICLVAAQSLKAREQYEGVEFRPYIPAAEVMPHCDWTICHGGQNTIIQSLVNEVPLIIFPGPIFERRFNARKIQSEGAGLMSEVNQFNPEWIRAALEKQKACAESAKRLGSRVRSFGGAAAAIQAMEEWSKLQRA